MKNGAFVSIARRPSRPNLRQRTHREGRKHIQTGFDTVLHLPEVTLSSRAATEVSRTVVGTNLPTEPGSSRHVEVSAPGRLVFENSCILVPTFWVGIGLLRRFMAKQPHSRSQSQASCRTRVKGAAGSDFFQSWHVGCHRAFENS